MGGNSIKNVFTLLKRVYSKRKESASIGSIFFPFRVDPLQKRIGAVKAESHKKLSSLYKKTVFLVQKLSSCTKVVSLVQKLSFLYKSCLPCTKVVFLVQKLIPLYKSCLPCTKYILSP